MGFAYYEFFSDSSCGGNVTYSSGVPAGICLPSIEFDIPGDYYAYGDAYNRTYQSFMINNLKGNFVSSYWLCVHTLLMTSLLRSIYSLFQQRIVKILKWYFLKILLALLLCMFSH